MDRRRRTAAATALSVLLFAGAAAAQQERGQVRELGGISIFGSKEAPRALYIVPWKSSELAAGTVGPDTDLGTDVLAPVDPEVFRRELHYESLINGR